MHSRFPRRKTIMSELGEQLVDCSEYGEAIMQAILDEMRDELPLAVQSNKGTEMYTMPFQQLLKFNDGEKDNIKWAMVENDITGHILKRHFLTALNYRKSCRQTILMWKPSWTLVS